MQRMMMKVGLYVPNDVFSSLMLLLLFTCEIRVNVRIAILIEAPFVKGRNSSGQ
jgi:hypothetical protein